MTGPEADRDRLADQYGPTPDPLAALVRSATHPEGPGATDYSPEAMGKRVAERLRANPDVVLRELGHRCGLRPWDDAIDGEMDVI